MKPTDVRIIEVVPRFSLEVPRAPLKFGAVVMKETTYCHTRVKVENRKGETAWGDGGMFLSAVWAFPDPDVELGLKDKAMRAVVERFAKAVLNYGRFAHPIEIFMELEPELRKIGDEVSEEFALPKKLPYLAVLVSASPIDCAIHDAFGKVNRICTYDGYTEEFMNLDLSCWLGERYKGKHPGMYLRKTYLKSVPVFHLVGGLDKLTESEVDESDPQDGLPNSLEGWIKRDGLFCLKVKLKGNDLDWDLERFLAVYKIAHLANRKARRFYFSLDTNEQCESPEYMIELLNKIKEREQRAFDELLFIEQPTERDLERHKFDMRKLANLKPVFIDESLTSLEDFQRAMQYGWSGIAVKTCKCHSKALLFISKAREEGIPYVIPDLTNPAIALLHSAGFAGRTYPLKGLEANSCQYFPKTSVNEARVHPGIFRRINGKLHLESLRGAGFGFRIEEIYEEMRIWEQKSTS
ncbi:mandelate racemase/muconate lactonizing enzyme family protein [bacterium]|nr:mandelate racemase/muconate lactonizing enzyme family protein [bacterium]